MNFLYKAALKKETDEASKLRLKKLEKELANLKEKFDTLKIKWEEEKKNIIKIKDIKEEIDRVKRQIEEAERNYDLEKLSELKYGTIVDVEKSLEEAYAKEEDDKMLKEEVTEEDIAKAIAYLHEEHHQIVEGAGAVGVAALLAGKIDPAGRKTGIVISGGNIDEGKLRDILVKY